MSELTKSERRAVNAMASGGVVSAKKGCAHSFHVRVKGGDDDGHFVMHRTLKRLLAAGVVERSQSENEVTWTLSDWQRAVIEVGENDYALRERAAIFEYDAGLSRRAAQRAAAQWYYEQR